MVDNDVEVVRRTVLTPMREALESIDAHLSRGDLHAAGMDMIDFLQLAEANSKTLLDLAARLSGSYPRLREEPPPRKPTR